MNDKHRLIAREFVTGALLFFGIGFWTLLLQGLSYGSSPVAAIMISLIVSTIAAFIAGLIWSLLAIFSIHDHECALKRIDPSYVEQLFGLHQVTVLTYAIPFDQLFQGCKNSIASIPYGRIVSEQKDHGTIYGQVGALGYLFGETVMIVVAQIDKKTCKITLSSKPTRMGGVIGVPVDYGRNITNIRLISSFLERLERRLGIEMPSP